MMEPLKDELIKIAERRIDELRGKADRLEAELSIIWEDLDDARATLHFLKTGKTELPKEHKKAAPKTGYKGRVPGVTDEQQRDWIVAQPTEFRVDEFAAAFDRTDSWARGKIKEWVKRGLVEVVGKQGKQHLYRYVHPNKG